ncbi:MAG: SUMF1/EgtB/PvdO family nonheme iron enzyme [Deltaproteobacteria bacterium]|nr:SUMF1/EgtB/PvdO family nonheme iron enzyme [Deltaproteobacteria bacterium]
MKSAPKRPHLLCSRATLALGLVLCGQALSGCFRWSWSALGDGGPLSTDDAEADALAPDAAEGDTVEPDALADSAVDSRDAGIVFFDDALPDVSHLSDARDSGDVAVRDASDARQDAASDAGSDASAPLPCRTWTTGTGRCIASRSCPVAGLVQCGVGRVDAPSMPFVFGREPAEPEVRVGISTVALDATEVTVERFRRFMSAPRGEVINAGATVMYPGGSVTVSREFLPPVSTDSDVRCNWTAAAGARESHPINCVDWHTAMAFCAWDGGRLPTESEHYYAVALRPIGGTVVPRRYPWGEDEPTSAGGVCTRAQHSSRAMAGTVQPCTSTPSNAATSPVARFAASEGLYDLTGNVTEWVGDRFDALGGRCWPLAGVTDPVCTMPTETRPLYATRGGDFAAVANVGDPNVYVLWSYKRIGYDERSRLPTVGFRCAYNMP